MVASSKSTVAKFTARAKNAKKTDDKLDNIANAIEDLAAFVDDLEQQLSGIRNQLKRIEDKSGSAAKARRSVASRLFRGG